MNHVFGGSSRFRRYTPRMLRTLDIEASPVAQPLLEAVDVLRSDATARADRLPAAEFTPSASTGTGFVIDRSGLILTNNHVVEKRDAHRGPVLRGTTSATRRACSAGTGLTDSALLELSSGPRGSSPWRGLQPDGAPGGWPSGRRAALHHTVTVWASRPSADRCVPVLGRTNEMLQTDGQSTRATPGGPLLNIRENTAIMSDRVSNAGVGFAVPDQHGVGPARRAERREGHARSLPSATAGR